MSTIKADNFTWKSGESSGQAQYTVTADKVILGTAKSWVNFNGTGTIAARASFNVSSLTDNGTGDYTINISSAMIDANYSYATSFKEDEGGTLAWSALLLPARVAQTSTTFRVICKVTGVGGTAYDAVSVSLIIAR